MIIKEKLIKKENEKKLFKLKCDYEDKKVDKKYRFKKLINTRNENKISYNSINYTKKRKSIFPNDYDSKEDINLLIKSPQKEYTPRLIINKSNLKFHLHCIKTPSRKKIKNIYFNNESKNKGASVAPYIYPNIRLPFIDYLKVKRNKNFFGKKKIYERKGAYESCNDLSYNLYSNKNDVRNKKEANKFVFDNIKMNNQSNFFKNQILFISNFVDKEMKDINDVIKKSYLDYSNKKL